MARRGGLCSTPATCWEMPQALASGPVRCSPCRRQIRHTVVSQLYACARSQRHAPARGWRQLQVQLRQCPAGLRLNFIAPAGCSLAARKQLHTGCAPIGCKDVRTGALIGPARDLRPSLLPGLTCGRHNNLHIQSPDGFDVGQDCGSRSCRGGAVGLPAWRARTAGRSTCGKAAVAAAAAAAGAWHGTPHIGRSRHPGATPTGARPPQ